MGHGSGIPIFLGNVLDTIPACLVIGSTFHSFSTLSLTLMLGMFIGGIQRRRRAPPHYVGLAFAPRRSSTFGRRFWWQARLAAAVGNEFIGGSSPLLTIFSEAVAGGAVLALVTHAMIPEAI